MTRPIDVAVNRFVQQQKLYQAALAGFLAQCFARHDARFGSARQYLEHSSGKAFQTLDNELVVGLHEQGAAAAQRGITTANRKLTKANHATLQDLALETISETIADIRNVLLRDRNTVRRLWQRFAVELTLTAPKHGDLAAIVVGQQKMDQLQFRQPDRAGKMWDSGVYVRALYRQLLLSLEVESCLFVLVKAGKDLAVASWDDDRHEVVFSISGKNTAHPSYLEIKDGLFHPNSTATVHPK
jgi:uncharacterized coiled-coil protein SlyX